MEKEKNSYLPRGKNRAGREEVCHALMDNFCEPRKPVPFKTSENTLRCCLCPLKIFSRCRGTFHPLRATAGNVKKLGENGKFLPDEKKIAKPLFCRYPIPAFLSSTISNGQVSEWSNEHAWKVCVPQTGTEGSNPSLSAINFPPQYTHNEYIAVFVYRGIGKKWGKELEWTIDKLLRK